MNLICSFPVWLAVDLWKGFFGQNCTNPFKRWYLKAWIFVQDLISKIPYRKSSSKVAHSTVPSNINSLKSFFIDKTFNLNPKLLIDLQSSLVDIKYHFRILGIKHELYIIVEHEQSLVKNWYISVSTDGLALTTRPNRSQNCFRISLVWYSGMVCSTRVVICLVFAGSYLLGSPGICHMYHRVPRLLPWWYKYSSTLMAKPYHASTHTVGECWVVQNHSRTEAPRIPWLWTTFLLVLCIEQSN